MKPKLFAFSGSLLTGKDYISSQLGCTTVQIPEPMYALADHFFGTHDKSVPGVREFLQRIGQYGLGTVSEKYPLTTERAAILEVVRNFATPTGRENAMRRGMTFRVWSSVDWANFGSDKLLWCRSADVRARDPQNDGKALSIPNIRFDHEQEFFKRAGWDLYHIYSSPETRAKRLQAAGQIASASALTDISEQLAIKLNTQIEDWMKDPYLHERNMRHLFGTRDDLQGKPFRVILNDPELLSMERLAVNLGIQPMITTRLLTVRDGQLVPVYSIPTNNA